MTDNIQQFEFKEHIRKRPYMYLGNSLGKGIINSLKGIFSDCIKQTNNESYFFRIEIKSNNEFFIELKSSNNLSNFIKSLNDDVNSDNFHFKVCKALSSEFHVSHEKIDDLTLTFKLDKTIITETVDYFELSEEFLQWTFLNRNSETLIINRRNKILSQNYYNFPEGVKYLYDRLVKETPGIPDFELSFESELNEKNYQIFVGYRGDWYPSPTIASYANDVYTVCHGSLIDGVLNGLKTGFKKYAKDNRLTGLKIKKKKFINGLILVATVRGDELNYGGSNKESLEDDNIKMDIEKVVKELVIDFISNNKEKTDNFIKRFDENQIPGKMY